MMKRKKKTNLILWLCDKEDCGASNTREILAGYVIVDDSCDYCGRAIHEPLTETLKRPKNDKENDG